MTAPEKPRPVWNLTGNERLNQWHHERLELEFHALKAWCEKSPWHAKQLAEQGDEFIWALLASGPGATYLPRGHEFFSREVESKPES